MLKENYLLYVMQTVLGYSKKTKEYILKRFIDTKIANKDDNIITGRLTTDGKELINHE